MDEIRLSEQEIAAFRELEARQQKLKLALGDNALKQNELRAEASQIIKSIYELAEAYAQGAKTAAIAHGIDVDDPAKGRWTFDGERYLRTDG